MNSKVCAAALAIAFFSVAWARPAATKPEQPVSLHPKNPHYFLFRGKAVAFITSGEHYGAVLNADSPRSALLRNCLLYTSPSPRDS